MDACTDFDDHANGPWLAATELPPDRARIGGFDALRAANDRLLEEGLAELAASPARQTTPGLKLSALLMLQAPRFNWVAWLRAYAGMGQAAATTQSLIVGQPGFAAGLAVLADKARLDTWRTYLRVRALDAMAEYGSHTMVSAHFDFYNGAIRSLKAAPPRVEQVILMVGGRTGGLPLGQTLGEVFVAKAFSPLAQPRELAMVADIKLAM